MSNREYYFTIDETNNQLQFVSNCDKCLAAGAVPLGGAAVAIKPNGDIYRMQAFKCSEQCLDGLHERLKDYLNPEYTD